MAFENRTLSAAAQGRVDGDRDAVLQDADLAGQDLARDDPVTGAVWDRGWATVAVVAPRVSRYVDRLRLMMSRPTRPNLNFASVPGSRPRAH